MSAHGRDVYNALGGRIQVAVVEEVEIFRRGLMACLADDATVAIITVAAEPPLPAPADVAVVSASVAARHGFGCPVVVCCSGHDEPRAASVTNDVAGVLARSTMTEAQLQATVRAAPAGCRVNAEWLPSRTERDALEPRSVRVLELLATGRSTREIAHDMSYSERTIKKLIHELERQFSARSRAQVVAQAIRLGLI